MEIVRRLCGFTCGIEVGYCVQHIVHSALSYFVEYWLTSNKGVAMRDRQFKFEVIWTLEQECEALIQDTWNAGNLSVPYKLERTFCTFTVMTRKSVESETVVLKCYFL
ncbi:hypothetical protein J1N35_024934 [Gossypium stocksii]|uniref:Uncharacterized protein n=1 Tax=Gossypium stocksii TaxID=47602 RepID=A0A9D3V6I3_9ROSI|nr:hypothetical protein J1N35_024934 [Gossypium stocksii]